MQWNDIHRRLDSTGANVSTGLTPTLEEKARILKARARLLAREAHAEKDEEKWIEILEFVVATERYGVETSYIREVYPLRDFTPLPCTPAFVLGVINFRGQILSVIDIKKFFGLPEKGLSDLNKVVIIRDNAMELGILADSILGVHSISLNDVQPSLPTLTGIRDEYLHAITNKRVVILDAGKILAAKSIVVHEDVET